MPRRSRLIFPEIPLHLIPRGNNRSVCFNAEDDKSIECKFRLPNNRGLSPITRLLRQLPPEYERSNRRQSL